MKKKIKVHLIYNKHRINQEEPIMWPFKAIPRVGDEICTSNGGQPFTGKVTSVIWDLTYKDVRIYID